MLRAIGGDGEYLAMGDDGRTLGGWGKIEAVGLAVKCPVLLWSRCLKSEFDVDVDLRFAGARRVFQTRSCPRNDDFAVRRHAGENQGASHDG